MQARLQSWLACSEEKPTRHHSNRPPTCSRTSVVSPSWTQTPRTKGASTVSVSGVRLEESTIEQVRERLRKMTDEQLLSFGKSAASVCKVVPFVNDPPPRAFVIQLEEARAEWRRRRGENAKVRQ